MNAGSEQQVEKIYKRDYFDLPIVYEISVKGSADEQPTNLIVKDVFTALPGIQNIGRQYRHRVSEIHNPEQVAQYSEIIVARQFATNKDTLVANNPRHYSHINRIICPVDHEVLEISENSNARILRLYYPDKVADRTFKELLDTNPDPDIVTLVMWHIANQIDLLHSIGISHGDISEDNVLIPDDMSEQNSSVLIDFEYGKVNSEEGKSSDLLRYLRVYSNIVSFTVIPYLEDYGSNIDLLNMLNRSSRLRTIMESVQEQVNSKSVNLPTLKEVFHLINF
jgi:serine/threonine protein kinase